MPNLFWRLAKDESGATSIEYALIAGGIFVAIVTTVQLLGPSLVAIFTNANNGLTGVAN